MKRQGLLSLTGILLMVMLALLTMHEWERVVPDGSATDQSNPPPALQLSGVTGRSFDEQGTLSFELDAGQLEWIESEGLSRITDPDLRLPLEQGEWLISAARGTVEEAADRISLEGQVTARRAGNMSLTLETERLDYLTRVEQVHTPAVRILSGQGRISAGRLKADLRTQVLELSEGVETRYVPQP